MADQNALATVVNRNSFYRDGYRVLLKIAFTEAVVIIVLLTSLIAALLVTEVKHVFFATTEDGRLIEIVPLDRPYLSDAEMLTWATETVKQVMDFNSVNYRQRLQANMTNFTIPDGWHAFTLALDQSRIIESIEKTDSTVTAFIESAPEILDRGVIPDANGSTYKWLIRIPRVRVEFKGGKLPLQPMYWEVRLKIARASTLQTLKGVAIEQWVAQPFR